MSVQTHEVEKELSINLDDGESLFAKMMELYPFAKWERVNATRAYPHTIVKTCYNCPNGADFWDNPIDRRQGTKEIIDRLQNFLQENHVSEVCTVTMWVLR